MDTASERSPVLTEHTLYLHVKGFNNLFINVVTLCLFSVFTENMMRL